MEKWMQNGLLEFLLGSPRQTPPRHDRHPWAMRMAPPACFSSSFLSANRETEAPKVLLVVPTSLPTGVYTLLARFGPRSQEF